MKVGLFYHQYSFICLLLIFVSSFTNAQEKFVDGKRNISQNFTDTLHLFVKKGDSLKTLKHYADAKSYFKKAFHSALDIRNYDITIDAGINYLELLRLTMKDADLKQSTKIHETLQSLCSTIKNTECLVRTNLILARIFTQAGDVNRALATYNESIAIALRENDSLLLSKCYGNRAVMLRSLNEVKQAHEDHRSSLKYLGQSTDSVDKSRVYLNMSTIYTEKDIDSSIYYVQKGLRYCKDVSKAICSSLYNNLANSLLKKNEAKKALEIMNNHINLDTVSKSNPFYHSLRYGILTHTYGSIYYELGDYELAIDKFLLAQKIFIDSKHLNNALLVTEDLANSYEKLGKLESSLQMMRMMRPLIDTLDTEKIRKEVAKIEGVRLLKEKEKQVVTLQEENKAIVWKMSKMQFASYILIGFLVIGVFIFFYKLKVNKVKVHELNEKVNYSRLRSLQSIMNPHFLFNSFGNLQHYILKNDTVKANEYMTTLSDLIRDVFSTSKSIYIPFNDELRILKSYLLLEKDRFDENFDVKYQIDETLQLSNPLIPSMILQPYLENSIIHGFSHMPDDVQKIITVTIDISGTRSIRCIITDNGIGREKVKILKKRTKNIGHLSVATKSIEERLRIINIKEKKKGKIIIEDLYEKSGKPAGTKVTIHLPIIDKKNNLIYYDY